MNLQIHLLVTAIENLCICGRKYDWWWRKRMYSLRSIRANVLHLWLTH